MRLVFAISLVSLWMQFCPSISVANEAEVRTAIQDYVKAFNAKDLKTIEKSWSENAVHVDHALAETTEGRGNIITDIKAVFEGSEAVNLSGTVDAVRMIGDRVAKVNGQVMVTVGAAEPSTSRYTAILVKGAEGWSIDSLEEFSVLQAGPGTAISQLSWLIGSWKDENADSPVQTTVRLSEGGNFLIRSAETSADDGTLAKSTQIIGWDPNQMQFRSWTFNSDGSFGEELWTNSANQWLIKSMQTLTSGSIALGTYALTPQGNDGFSVRLIDRQIDGQMQPSTPEVRVRRDNSPTNTETKAP